MQEKKYPGEITDANVSRIFDGAADFIRRELKCGGFQLYAYAIDGLIASGAASDYIFKPITQDLAADTIEELYQKALHGGIYNCVAVPCKDLTHAAFLLVNGFCVVLFSGVGAIAYEVKTPDKRGPQPRRWRTPSRAQRMLLWRLSVPTPVISAGTCVPRICGSMKRRWAGGA